MKDNNITVVRSSIEDYQNDPNFDTGDSSYLPRWKIKKDEKKVFSYQDFSTNFMIYKKVGEINYKKTISVILCKYLGRNL